MNIQRVSVNCLGIAAIALGLIHAAPAGADTLEYTARLGEKTVKVTAEGAGAGGQITPKDIEKALKDMKVEVYHEYMEAKYEEQEKMKSDLRAFKAMMKGVAKVTEKLYEETEKVTGEKATATVTGGPVAAAIIIAPTQPTTAENQH